MYFGFFIYTMESLYNESTSYNNTFIPSSTSLSNASFIWPLIINESMYCPVEKTYLKFEKGFPSLLSSMLSPKLKL